MSDVTAGIYGGGPLYENGEASIDDLRASGFTTVVGWCIHPYANGDLYLDMKIAADGAYVGGDEFAGLMARLKQAPTSVNRLILSVGSSDPSDWTNIQSLVKAQGIGPDSILYRNFAALKAAIPSIDAIDFDDETVYDPNTTVPFAGMLHELGFQVTFCPFTNMDFWVECLSTLNTSVPGLVTAFNLQCYAGGEGNDPGDWVTAIKNANVPGAAGLVQPGLWCRNGDGCGAGMCPSDVESQMSAWKAEGITGGWIWLLDDLYKCQDSGVCSGGMGSADYAKAIIAGLS